MRDRLKAIWPLLMIICVFCGIILGSLLALMFGEPS